jgi:hypothetical protein
VQAERVITMLLVQQPFNRFGPFLLFYFMQREIHRLSRMSRSWYLVLYWLLGISVPKYEKLEDCPFTFFDTMTIFSFYFKPFSERMSQVASKTLSRKHVSFFLLESIAQIGGNCSHLLRYGILSIGVMESHPSVEAPCLC